MTQKPRYRFCWWCSKKFRGNHHSTLETAGGLVHVHVECGKAMKAEGAGWDAGN